MWHFFVSLLGVLWLSQSCSIDWSAEIKFCCPPSIPRCRIGAEGKTIPRCGGVTAARREREGLGGSGKKGLGWAQRIGGGRRAAGYGLGLKAGVRGAVPSGEAPAQMMGQPFPRCWCLSCFLPPFYKGTLSLPPNSSVMNFCHHAACLQYTLNLFLKKCLDLLCW